MGKTSLVFAFIFTVTTFTLHSQQVTTYAGKPGDNGFTVEKTSALDARFDEPFDVAVDSNGNLVISDMMNNAIMIRNTQGNVLRRGGGGPSSASHADGHYTNSRFNGPEGVAIGPDGSIYIADTWNSVIRKITPYIDETNTMMVSTIAGKPGVFGYLNGPGALAEFEMPSGIAVDNAGNIYVTEPNSHIIRQITPAGVVSLYSGTPGVIGNNDGARANATFYRPGPIFARGNDLYIAEQFGRRIRKIDASGNVTTVVDSTDNPRLEGSLIDPNPANRPGMFRPSGIAVAPNGDIYITDNNVVRVIRNDSMLIYAAMYDSTGSIDGFGKDARFNLPLGLGINKEGTKLYLADSWNHIIRQIELNADTTTDTTVTSIPDFTGRGRNIDIFPVPVVNELNFTFETEALRELFIFDMNGRKLLSSDSREKNVSLNVRSLKSGTYVVAIAEQGRFIRQQVIIKD